MGTGLALGFGDQRESLQWLLGVTRSKGQKKIPRKKPLEPVTATPAAAAVQGTWQELHHLKLVIQGEAWSSHLRDPSPLP